MNDGGIRRFRADDYYELKGRGRLWTGPSPFEWKFDDGIKAFPGPWSIDHPDADPTKVYRVVAVEAYCLATIRAGAPMGLLLAETSA